MRSSHFFILCTLLSLFSTARAQTGAPPDLHVKLSLADNKNVYRIGEPIKLVLEFTADRKGYTVEVIPEQKEPALDTILVSPDAGVTRWLDEFTDNRSVLRDMFSDKELGASPERIEIVLNDTVRFDSPGSYTVHVMTGRVWKPEKSGERRRILTNPVTFEVQAMSEADEAQEVERLKDPMDAHTDPRMNNEPAQRLSYLTGDPSTREKVRRFLYPEPRRNYDAHIWYGFPAGVGREIKTLAGAMARANSGSRRTVAGPDRTRVDMGTPQ